MTLVCCWPLGFAAATATATLGVLVARLRPWLLGAAAVLLAVGFAEMYFRRQCRRSRMNIALFWLCAAIVIGAVCLPQLFATAGGSASRPGQPSLTVVDARSMVLLRADFNSASDDIRVILLLSPT